MTTKYSNPDKFKAQTEADSIEPTPSAAMEAIRADGEEQDRRNAEARETITPNTHEWDGNRWVKRAAAESSGSITPELTGRKWDGQRWINCTMEEQEAEQARLASVAASLEAERDAAARGQAVAAENASAAAGADPAGDFSALIAARLGELVEQGRRAEERAAKYDALRERCVSAIDVAERRLSDAMGDGRGVGSGGAPGESASGGAAVVVPVPRGGGADDVPALAGGVVASAGVQPGGATWRNRCVKVYGWFHTQMRLRSPDAPFMVCDRATVVDPWVFLNDPREPGNGIKHDPIGGLDDDDCTRGNCGGPVFINHEHEIRAGGLMEETVSLLERCRAWAPGRRLGVYGVPSASLYPNQQENVLRWNAERAAAHLFSRVDFLCVNGYWDDGGTLDNGAGGLYREFCERAAAVAGLLTKPIVICISHRTARGTLIPLPVFEFMMSAIERAFRRFSHLLEGVAFFVGNDDTGKPDDWSVALPYALQARVWADRLKAEAGPWPSFALAPAGPVS